MSKEKKAAEFDSIWADPPQKIKAKRGSVLPFTPSRQKLRTVQPSKQGIPEGQEDWLEINFDEITGDIGNKYRQ